MNYELLLLIVMCCTIWYLNLSFICDVCLWFMRNMYAICCVGLVW